MEGVAPYKLFTHILTLQQTIFIIIIIINIITVITVNHLTVRRSSILVTTPIAISLLSD